MDVSKIRCSCGDLVYLEIPSFRSGDIKSDSMWKFPEAVYSYERCENCRKKYRAAVVIEKVPKGL